MVGARNTMVFSSSLLLIVGDTVGLSPGSRLARAVTTGGVGGGGRAEEIDFADEEAEEGTPNDNDDGDDGSGSSDEDEAEALEVDDQKHAAKQQATFEILEREVARRSW